MRSGYLILLLLLLGSIQANAQNNPFAIGSIPDSVKKDASIVKREEDIELDIDDIDRAKLNVHQVLTVLDEKGKSALVFAQETDKYKSLEDVEIRTYDAQGKNMAKYKQKDLILSGYGESLIDDAVDYLFMVPSTAYPITVEYKYTIRFKDLLNLPRFEIMDDGEGVESSTFSAKIRSGMDIRHLAKNIDITPTVADDGKYKTYTWSVKNLKPVEDEEGSASDESRFPTVLLAPNHFKLDNYEGDMTDWKSFGKWYGLLQQGMDVLPPDRVAFYKALVKDARDDRERVGILYSYLQQNFRYVSIQLGIGGYKPLSAAFTDNKKYGDCKGLCNYMQAILEAIGIRSYQALINAEYNSEPVDPAFPCNLFDHVILCVPQPKGDTLWLECTSRTEDFGHLGSFTENRNALLITEEGGVLVRTPQSHASDNTFSAFTRIDLQDDGSGKTTTRVATTGEYKEEAVDLGQKKSDDQKAFLIDELGFKDPDEILFPGQVLPGVYGFQIGQHLETIPQLKTGSKMFLPVRIYLPWSVKLPDADKRHMDFYFPNPFIKTDTTVYNLPDGYQAEAFPDSVSKKCKYASYAANYGYDNQKHQVWSVVRIELNRNRIPVKDYAVVKDFFDTVLQDGTQKIVIRKTLSP